MLQAQPLTRTWTMDYTGPLVQRLLLRLAKAEMFENLQNALGEPAEINTL
jgi:hypothetical protein